MRIQLIPAAIGALFMAATLFSPPRAAANPYTSWTQGPPHNPGYFPIAVWLQSPENAAKFEAAGINLYVALWQGPTEDQLKKLKAAGMHVVCAQNAVGLAHLNDPTIVAWMHGDEPDNAQEVTDPKTGKKGYGGPVPPPKVVAEYDAIRAKDPTRPVLLNLGQGVANDQWLGRGSGARPDDYLTYVKGSDIVSFDVYPIAGLDRPDRADLLWWVSKGVDRLKQWSDDKKIIWNCIEASPIDSGRTATPAQIRSEVWMSLIHGSRGIIYFNHRFKPTFDGHYLLDDPTLLAGVTAINRQIHDLAPELNSPTLTDALTIHSSEVTGPIDGMVKRVGGSTFVFTAAMRNVAARADFQLRGIPRRARAAVIGEDRSIPVINGQFEDSFQPFQVHLYQVK